MATNNDLIIDTSYTNKDFNTIYPELLDLVKKLTNKWDPSLSNESDPGVLLLKLNAIIADKNNYNIDKNILECFPLSVTQEGNARRLYDNLGYQMRWYNSAITDIKFQLTSVDNFTRSDNGLLHNIPQFTYLIDDSGEIVYSILKAVNLYNTTDIVTVPAIEGKVFEYTINGDKIITIANLDNDLRLYFDETHIAENGIFIKNTTDDYFDIDIDNDLFSGWKRVDNLASYTTGNKVFQFGILPNSNTCYIQFPQDITNLIGDGLQICYTISNGENGNIKSNVITTFYADQTSGYGDQTKVVNDFIRITQSIPATDGRNPETLNEAYNNFKRTVGTFNTLVTKKDYENYIYRYKNSNRDLCSNIVVTDRTNDLNYTNYIQTWTANGNQKVLKQQPDALGNTLTAYNIVFYALTAQPSIYDITTYDKTFMPNIDLESDIELAIADTKAAQHDLKIPLSSQKFGYWNLYTIKGSLLTYKKITLAEAAEIEANVKQKLYTLYNAKQVSYGVEIDINALIDDIVSADSRIKNVLLTNTSYMPVAYNGSLVSTNSATAMDDNLNNELVAKMILSGNTQLFKFDDNFLYEFGQKDAEVLTARNDGVTTAIKSITSETTIEVPVPTLDTINSGYKLKENEMVQVYAPNLITVTEYSTYVKYWFEGNTVIPANVDTLLKDNDVLHLSYTDTNGNVVTRDLKAGTIINASVTINSAIAPRPIDTVTTKYLASGQTIKVKAINSASLSLGTKYYFIMNNTQNELRINSIDGTTGNWSKSDYILQENEYFIYTNSTTDELIILGSGTKLSMPEGYAFYKSLPRVDLTNLTESIEDINWAKLDQYCVNTTSAANLAELEFITTDLDIRVFGKGTIIATPTSITLSNTPQKLEYVNNDNIDNPSYNSVFYYKLSEDAEWSYIYLYPELNEYWYAQSRLIINTTQDAPQLLAENHSITLEFNVENAEVFEEIKGGSDSTYIMFNEPVLLSGGERLNAQVLNDKGEYDYSLKAYTFKSSNIVSDAGIVDISTMRNIDTSLINISGEKIKNITLPFTFTFDDNTDSALSYYSWLIPISIQLNTKNASIKFSTTSANGSVKIFNPTILVENETTAVFTKTTDDDFKVAAILHIVSTNGANVSDLKIELTGCTDKDYINIGYITKLDGINTDEINDDTSTTAYKIAETDINGNSIYDNYYSVLSNIKNIDPENIFDWTYKVKPIDKVVNPTNAASYWNANHVYNAFVLPKIDFKKYSLTVNATNIT